MSLILPEDITTFIRYQLFLHYVPLCLTGIGKKGYQPKGQYKIRSVEEKQKTHWSKDKRKRQWTVKTTLETKGWTPLTLKDLEPDTVDRNQYSTVDVPAFLVSINWWKNSRLKHHFIVNNFCFK